MPFKLKSVLRGFNQSWQADKGRNEQFVDS